MASRSSLSKAKSQASLRNSEDDQFKWDDHGTYMHVKRRKLQEQFNEIGECKNTIFAGVVVYVNGYTQPNAEDLKSLIQAHGGGYEYMPYAPRITHVIAANLPTAKIRHLTSSKRPVCTPSWILDSVAAGRLLPVEQYKLYSTVSKGQQQLSSFVQGHSSAIGNDSRKHDHQLEASEEVIGVSNDSADFVSAFYSHSRLHYLSTWGNDMKQFTNKMLPKAVQKIPRLSSSLLRANQQRAIVHVDVDCFFVQVSTMGKPLYQGKPVAVTHAKKSVVPHSIDETHLNVSESGPQSPAALPSHLLHSTSDVASCSYEARQCGVKNGMSVGEALKKCPNLLLVPYDFDMYKQISQQLYETLMTYSHKVEAVSCDEVYLELTDYANNFEEVIELVQQMRTEIENKTKCTVSAGISHNMLLARMATRKAKPNGQFYLSLVEAEEYMLSQPVGDLPGVGWSLKKKLDSLGIVTCADLQKLSLADLKTQFGDKTGRSLYQCSRGISERELKLDVERKSVSVDINFGIRFKKLSEAVDLISQLAQELEKRSSEAMVTGSCVTLKMKIRKENAPIQTKKYLGHGACDNVSRSTNLHSPTCSAKLIARTATQLLHKINVLPSDIRGMGLQLTKLLSVEKSLKKLHGSADIRSLLSAPPPSTSSTSAPPPSAPPPSAPPPSSPPPSAPPPSSPPSSAPHPSALPPSVASKPTSSCSGYEGPSSAWESLPSCDLGASELDLPPASQLDTSVLLELPADLQESIFESYSIQAKRKSAMASTSKTDDKEVDKPVHLPDMTKKSAPAQHAIVIHDQDKFVAEMRQQIKEWVISSPNGPRKDDCEIVCNFLTNICPQNLMVTDLTLKCFRRSVVSNGAQVWITIFNNMLRNVQSVMTTHYVGTLPIEPIQDSQAQTDSLGHNVIDFMNK